MASAVEMTIILLSSAHKESLQPSASVYGEGNGILISANFAFQSLLKNRFPQTPTEQQLPPASRSGKDVGEIPAAERSNSRTGASSTPETWTKIILPES